MEISTHEASVYAKAFLQENRLDLYKDILLKVIETHNVKECFNFAREMNFKFVSPIKDEILRLAMDSEDAIGYAYLYADEVKGSELCDICEQVKSSKFYDKYKSRFNDLYSEQASRDIL